MSRSRDMHDESRRFAQDVDALLAGQPAEAREQTADDAYQGDLALAHLLGRAGFVADPRFRSRLRSHLLYQLHDRKEMEVRTMSPIRMFRSLARSALVAGLSAALVLGVVFAASPDARASAQDFLARFVEVDSPWALLLGAEKGPASRGVVPGTEMIDSGGPGDEATGGPGPVPGVGATESRGDGEGGLELPSLEELPVPDELASRELASLEAAQTGLSFEIRMPSVLPDGYSLLGAMPRPDLPTVLPDLGIRPPAEAGVELGEVQSPPGVKPPTGVQPPQSVTLIFGNAAGETLTLSEMHMTGLEPPGGVALPAGRGSVQEVTVNGQAAQYVEGRWTENGWVSDGLHQLHWQDGDMVYDLVSLTLGLDELLRVAESID